MIPNHEDTKTQRVGEFEPIPAGLEKVAAETVDAAYKVHKALGPGLLESVYEACLLHELRRRGIKVQTQVELPIVYEGLRLEQDCDLICSLRIVWWWN